MWAVSTASERCSRASLTAILAIRTIVQHLLSLVQISSRTRRGGLRTVPVATYKMQVDDRVEVKGHNKNRGPIAAGAVISLVDVSHLDPT